MSLRPVITLLLIALATTGCDKITGEAEQKTRDAEAIGYACRVSSKAPADCISDNEAHSPTSLLVGWKAADQDILARLLDPSMGKDPATAAHLPVSAEKTDSTKHGASAAEGTEAASGEHPDPAAEQAPEDKPEKKSNKKH